MSLRQAGIALILLIADLASAGALDSREPGYDELAPHKAAAVAIDDVAIVGIASNETSDAAASLTALQHCRDVRRTPPVVCEITRLNDSTITSANAIRAAVPRTPHPLFLWRIDTTSGRLYLAGSIHVMKPSLYPLPIQFDTAFQQADRLVVEINTNALDGATAQEKFRSYALLPDGQSVDTLLRPATLAAVTAHLTAQSMALANVAAMKPAIIASQLAITRLTAIGYLPEFGLEQHFIAASGTRPILELETLDEQLRVLTSPSFAVQDQMLLETLEQMDIIEPMVAAMVTAWLAGDDNQFRRLFDQQSGTSPDLQAFMRRLIEDRNIGMAEKIAAYQTLPGTTFVLVGAAHLTGPEGIVALLEARGIRVRRVQSNEQI